jgi:hypothetical protein
MSVPASLSPSLPAAILQTVLTTLAPLFLLAAGGDTDAARQAAAQMLAAYHPETEDELRLAASVVSFSFHALEALSQAAQPDLSLTRVLRLRGSAVSLSRESAKADRRLAQLQKARQQAIPAKTQPQPQPEPCRPTVTIPETPKADAPAVTKTHEQHLIDLRIAASIKRAEARVAAYPNTALPQAATGPRPMAHTG